MPQGGDVRQAPDGTYEVAATYQNTYRWVPLDPRSDLYAQIQQAQQSGLYDDARNDQEGVLAFHVAGGQENEWYNLADALSYAQDILTYGPRPDETVYPLYEPWPPERLETQAEATAAGRPFAPETVVDTKAAFRYHTADVKAREKAAAAEAKEAAQETENRGQLGSQAAGQPPSLVPTPFTSGPGQFNSLDEAMAYSIDTGNTDQAMNIWGLEQQLTPYQQAQLDRDDLRLVLQYADNPDALQLLYNFFVTKQQPQASPFQVPAAQAPTVPGLTTAQEQASALQRYGTQLKSPFGLTPQQAAESVGPGYVPALPAAMPSPFDPVEPTGPFAPSMNDATVADLAAGPAWGEMVTGGNVPPPFKVPDEWNVSRAGWEATVLDPEASPEERAQAQAMLAKITRMEQEGPDLSFAPLGPVTPRGTVDLSGTGTGMVSPEAAPSFNRWLQGLNAQAGVRINPFEVPSQDPFGLGATGIDWSPEKDAARAQVQRLQSPFKVQPSFTGFLAAAQKLRKPAPVKPVLRSPFGAARLVGAR